MLPNRPRITDLDTDKIVAARFGDAVPELLVIAVRGYFLNTLGVRGVNDFNIWDDAFMVIEAGRLVRTFNGNTDPSKRRAGKAMLKPGLYRFARGMHRQRIRAFRAFPEGVRLPCTRENAAGKWVDSTAQFINIHDGGRTDTWSDGCLTLPNWQGATQFNEFRDLCYEIMRKRSLSTLDLLLIDEPEIRKLIG